LRILVADDHAEVRKAVCAILKSHEKVRVCFEAANGEDAVRMALRLRPDLVVLDIYMPVLDGLDAARKIREQLPDLPILMITTSPDAHLLEISLEVGVQGFINKNELAEFLLPATESLLAKGTFFPQTEDDKHRKIR